jgi:hypothetical protein
LIRLTIRLAIVLAIVNAVAHAGFAAWHYYELKDEAQQLITFGFGRNTNELHSRILAKAVELEVPLAPENLYVTREGTQTFVDVTYTQPVEYFPGYTYTVPFSFSVDAIAVRTSNTE